MNDAQKQLADKLKTANYVLVTVSHDPSVDQLAALIGLTLLLNKTGKHAAAVFSGQVPSTLDFLKPEDTIEQTTDSLRDFIIALDKSKADKLRYKVEDDVVRIFITPYKTSISQDDLEFSQGDFNVDVVVALGVTQQQDLDQAIVQHGRILHDATVATVNLSAEGDLGSIHWQNPKASSLSEMITNLAEAMGKELVDNQIATALLTGIVAETERFSNDKTSPEVMTASAMLMAAGANQQLVAAQLAQPVADSTPAEQVNDDWKPEDLKLDESADEPAEPEAEAPKDEEPSLQISHEETPEAEPEFMLPELEPETAPEPEAETEPADHISGGSKLITEPPTLGGQLTANSQVEQLEGTSDPFSQTPQQDGLLTRGEPLAPLPTPELQPVSELPELPALPELPPLPPVPAEPVAPQTLNDIETSVKAEEHPADVGLDAARDEVLKALNSTPDPSLPPVQALNATPMADSLHAAPVPELPTVPAPATPAELSELPNDIPALPVPPSTLTPGTDVSVAFDPTAFGLTPESGMPVPGTQPPAGPAVVDPNAAPPVPPPIPFNFGTPPTPPTPPAA